MDQVTTTPTSAPSEGLSGGAIAALVIGVLAFVFMVVVLVLVWRKWKRLDRNGATLWTPTNPTHSGGDSNKLSNLPWFYRKAAAATQGKAQNAQVEPQNDGQNATQETSIGMDPIPNENETEPEPEPEPKPVRENERELEDSTAVSVGDENDVKSVTTENPATENENAAPSTEQTPKDAVITLGASSMLLNRHHSEISCYYDTQSVGADTYQTAPSPAASYRDLPTASAATPSTSTGAGAIVSRPSIHSISRPGPPIEPIPEGTAVPLTSEPATPTTPSPTTTTTTTTTTSTPLGHVVQTVIPSAEGSARGSAASVQRLTNVIRRMSTGAVPSGIEIVTPLDLSAPRANTLSARGSMGSVDNINSGAARKSTISVGSAGRTMSSPNVQVVVPVAARTALPAKQENLSLSHSTSNGSVNSQTVGKVTTITVPSPAVPVPSATAVSTLSLANGMRIVPPSAPAPTPAVSTFQLNNPTYGPARTPLATTVIPWAPTVRVPTIPGRSTITLTILEQAPNERVCIVGGTAIFGNWDPTHAPEMVRHPRDPTLFVLVVPTETLARLPEFKFARIGQKGEIAWLQGQNLRLSDVNAGLHHFKWV